MSSSLLDELEDDCVLYSYEELSSLFDEDVQISINLKDKEKNLILHMQQKLEVRRYSKSTKFITFIGASRHMYWYDGNIIIVEFDKWIHEMTNITQVTKYKNM